mgnify:CR=1 FL=1
MDEAARLLHISGRLIEISEILLSLSAGAILLIATFLRNAPPVKRAGMHVDIGLSFFTVSLMSALVTIIMFTAFEGHVLFEAQEAKLRAKSDTSETGKPASAEPRAEPETQDNEKETEKQAEIGRDFFIVQARRTFAITVIFFGLAVLSMLTLGWRITSSWKDKSAPSS